MIKTFLIAFYLMMFFFSHCFERNYLELFNCLLIVFCRTSQIYKISFFSGMPAAEKFLVPEGDNFWFAIQFGISVEESLARRVKVRYCR